VLAFVVPWVVFLVLVVVGRRLPAPAANEALAAPPSDAEVDAAPEAMGSTSSPIEALADGAPSVAVSDAAPEASPAAVEPLPDGGVSVDLNLADEDDLCKLPGIGPTRARAILALRAKLGRLKSVDDLARIKGMGRKLLRRLRPMARFTG